MGPEQPCTFGITSKEQVSISGGYHNLDDFRNTRSTEQGEGSDPITGDPSLASEAILLHSSRLKKRLDLTTPCSRTRAKVVVLVEGFVGVCTNVDEYHPKRSAPGDGGGGRNEGGFGSSGGSGGNGGSGRVCDGGVV